MMTTNLRKLFMLSAWTVFSMANAQSVEIGDISLKINVIEYNPPTLVSKISDTEKFFWLPAYTAVKSPSESKGYGDWVRHFSKEYIEQYGMDESLYSEALSEKPNYPAPDRTALYGLLVKLGSREFFILKLSDTPMDTVPESLFSPQNYTVTKLFEKSGGTWVNQLYPEAGIAMDLPYNELNKIRALLERGYGEIDTQTRKIVESAVSVTKDEIVNSGASATK